MSNLNQHPLDELDEPLASAVSALRRAAPPGPAPSLVNATLARLAAPTPAHAVPAPVAAAAPLPWWRSNWRIAAGWFLVVTMLLAAVFYALPARFAFADVVRRIATVRSVRFTQVIHPAAGEPVTADVLLAEPARLRIEIQTGLARGAVTIVDLKNPAGPKGLILSPLDKSAADLNASAAPRGKQRLQDLSNLNLVDQFRNWADAAHYLGNTRVDQHSFAQFAISRPGEEITILADPQSQLPYRVEVRWDGSSDASGTVGAGTLTFSNFQWDQPFPQEALSLQIPPGYHPASYSLDLMNPTESDLVNSLELFAKLRGGTFPDDLSLMGIFNTVQAAKATATKPGNANRQDTIEAALSAGRGLIYAGNEQYGSDWHYAGKGVKLGENDRPILWYRPTGSALYRVIDAQLNITETPPETLPKVPSKGILRIGGNAPPEK